MLDVVVVLPSLIWFVTGIGLQLLAYPLRLVEGLAGGAGVGRLPAD